MTENIAEDIKKLEKEIENTPYNKATQRHIGKLKARIARLKEKQDKKEKGTAKGKEGFGVKKTGDATVLLVGLPSVGKSSLLQKLTNAEPKIADYGFTTLEVIPGMMEYRGAKIQILDVPGVISGASSGKGRGKEVLSVARAADLICIVLEASENIKEQIKTVEEELYQSGFRLDQKSPDVKIYHREQGGLKVTLHRNSKLDPESVKDMAREVGINNADIVLREKLDQDRFIDSLMKNRVYVPSLKVINKIDLLEEEDVPKIDNSVSISALEGTNLKELKQKMWKKLRLIRIYMKQPGEEPDRDKPLIMEKGSTIEDVSQRIHKDFQKNFKHARIWGSSAKFPGQTVGLSHQLKDKDTVELHAD